MIVIDPPNAAGHGRLWSHLASDTSFDELHAFARELGIPERGFDRDHYDVPSEWYDAAVAAGAVPVTSRELIARLVAAGLRRRKLRVSSDARGQSRDSSASTFARAAGSQRSPAWAVWNSCGLASRSLSTAARPARKSSSETWAYSRRTSATYSA